MMIFLYFIAAAVIFLIVWILAERQVIITRRKDIFLDELPASFENFSILHISDIHHREFGRNQSRIIKRAEMLSPDIIVITGDLISRDMRDFSVASSFVKQLSEIAPVYFSAGNHELDLPEKVRDTYFSSLKKSGAVLLLNSKCNIKKSSDSLCIAGITLERNVYRDENNSFRNLIPYSSDKIVQLIGVREVCTLLLAHNPLMFDSYAEWNADLVLSGHVHGGIVRLPFIGGLLSPERKFFPRYTQGLYKDRSSQMYVSAGLGKLRIFNPPQIDFLTLHKK